MLQSNAKFRNSILCFLFFDAIIFLDPVHPSQRHFQTSRRQKLLSKKKEMLSETKTKNNKRNRVCYLFIDKNFTRYLRGLKS
jgi:hypothetical protein